MLAAQSRNYLPIAILLSLCLLIALSYTHTYYEPLFRDVTTYAVIAHEMLQGRVLYTDLWDIKPPAIFITFAAAELIAGYGLGAIYLLNLVGTILTLFGVYYAGIGLNNSRNGGLWAAGCWTIITGSLAFEGNQPNVELFINSCLIWAFALLIRNESLTYGKTAIIGLLFALASLYKHVSVVASVLLCLIYIIIPPKGSTVKSAIFQIGLMGIIGILAWGITIGYFAITGRFAEFYEIMVTFNQAYAGNLLENLEKGFQLIHLFPIPTVVAFPIAFLTLLGLIIGIVQRNRSWFLLFAYIIAIIIMIALPGQFSRHYYQLWLPALCVGSGWTLVILRDLINTHFRKYGQRGANSVGVLAISGLLYFHLPIYQMTPYQISYQKYGEVFILVELVSKQINELLQTDETFYQWGLESGLFFYTQRPPPSGVFFHSPLTGGPLVEKLSLRVIQDLERKQPELLILSEEVRVPTQHTLMQWLSPRYRSYRWLDSQDGKHKVLHLLVRIGGKLEKRLMQKEKSKKIEVQPVG